MSLALRLAKVHALVSGNGAGRIGSEVEARLLLLLLLLLLLAAPPVSAAAGAHILWPYFVIL